MKRDYVKKMLVGVAIAAMLGFGTHAFAGWGMGYGQQGMGYGHHGMGYGEGGPGYGTGRGMHGGGYPGTLSEDQVKKIDEQRRIFFEETKDLRHGMYQKGLELRSELAKREPDTKRAYDLQKEISDLRAQLGQKRIDQHIKMRKLNPDGFGGRGFGRGPMARGFGPRGGGSCW
jgi:hypothetical protein